MAELLFYHLERRGLEEVLPKLVEMACARGWKALIRCESADRAADLDRLLWTYDDQSFLPHGMDSEPEAARQPVLISAAEGKPGGADILFLVGGASGPDWSDPATSAFTRIVLVFDGRDPSAVARAREDWKLAKQAGLDLTYWKESAGGKWEKQG